LCSARTTTARDDAIVEAGKFAESMGFEVVVLD